MFICFVGKETNVTEVPWHVGIYLNDTQICGGTIVSERVVISAAHCFSDNIDFMHTFDVKTYKVAAGRITRGLKELNKLKTQIRDLQEVQISRK